MTQAITGSLDDALVHWNKLGCKGNNKRVRVLNNASEAQGKSYFDLLTKNGVDITSPSAPPGLIVKRMPDNSTITFRNTASQSPNTSATIDFNGGNYLSSEIKKLKFNN